MDSWCFEVLKYWVNALRNFMNADWSCFDMVGNLGDMGMLGTGIPAADMAFAIVSVRTGASSPS